MLVFNYESKKALKESIGKPLRYIETSIFGEENKQFLKDHFEIIHISDASHAGG